MKHPIPSAWRTPLTLIGLSLVPFAATANRLVWILSDSRPQEANMIRYDGEFVSLTVHILTGMVFLILASVQFSPELRARYRSWHRGAGKVAIVAGISAGLSGMWLVASYPPGPMTTLLLDAVRSVAGAALAACVLLAFRAIRRGDPSVHRVWMIRSFALGVAGTTQALLIGVWTATVGPLSPESATLLIPLGFAVNIVVGEAIIRGRGRGSIQFIKAE